MKKFIIFILIILLALLAWFMFVGPKDVKAPTVGDDLEIKYVNSTADNIQVELPFPGAVTGKEFSVIGEARGGWYFEATFPIDVLDKDGNVLVSWYAEAQGEWMTPEFVPFKGDIVVPESYIGPATLVLHRSNASGLPEHDASISFPFNIEY